MPRTVVQIGPADHGKRMSIEEFEHAEAKKGFTCELSRGVVVIDAPDPKHQAQVDAINRQFSRYQAAHPEEIHLIARGDECRILLPRLKSERHPDLAIYKEPPPEDEGRRAKWMPEIVIEVASRSSHRRDYVEKREEYLQSREYWIVDADPGYLVALRRSRGRWGQEIVRPTGPFTTRLLPGFKLNLKAVFAAARAVKVI